MAIYRPKRGGKVSKFYVCEFVYQGKRFQESTGATSKTVAKEYEKRRKAEMERAAVGMPIDSKASRIRTVTEVTRSYLECYKLNHRANSIVFARGCLKHVEEVLGTSLLSDLTEERIYDYIRRRQGDRASGRTINMELGEFSRAIGQPWSLLWPKIRKLEERKNVGRALSAEEQARLLSALNDCRTPHLPTLIPLLLLTGMRSGEALGLTWAQVDLIDQKLTVGRAKTSNGTGRTIPINTDLASIFGIHRANFVNRFGSPEPAHYVFAWGSPWPSNPTHHVTGVKHAWESLRTVAKVNCRLHDLRHTFATRLAENGVPESTMLALMGHMSRAMLERYSHVRMLAKRDAVHGITLHPKQGNSETVPVKVPVLGSVSLVQ
jgi:integrase